MKETYKDNNINYDEDSNEWRVSIGDRYDEYESFNSLKQAKAFIDKRLKIKYVPVECWILRSGGWSQHGFKNIIQAKVTRPHVGDKFWIAYKGGRETFGKEHIYIDTPENRRKFPLIASIEKEIQDKEKEKRELLESLERIEGMRQID